MLASVLHAASSGCGREAFLRGALMSKGDSSRVLLITGRNELRVKRSSTASAHA